MCFFFGIGNILALLFIVVLFIVLLNFNYFSDLYFLHCCYFIESLKVWKKPKHNLLRNKNIWNSEILRNRNNKCHFS